MKTRSNCSDRLRLKALIFRWYGGSAETEPGRLVCNYSYPYPLDDDPYCEVWNAIQQAQDALRPESQRLSVWDCVAVPLVDCIFDLELRAKLKAQANDDQRVERD